jgi:hypothetical protein
MSQVVKAQSLHSLHSQEWGIAKGHDVKTISIWLEVWLKSACLTNVKP